MVLNEMWLNQEYVFIGLGIGIHYTQSLHLLDYTTILEVVAQWVLYGTVFATCRTRFQSCNNPGHTLGNL